MKKMYKPASPMQRFALLYKHFNNSQMEKDIGKKIKTKKSTSYSTESLKHITFKMWKTAPPISFL